MSASEERVREIIEQIETNGQESRADGKKTIAEVLDIFLKDTPRTTENRADPADADELTHWKEQMNQTYQISFDREIICYRRHFRRLVIFVKRVIRKACRSMIQPIVEEQCMFNANTTAAVNSIYNLCQGVSSSSRQIADLKGQLEDAKKESELCKSALLEEIRHIYAVCQAEQETLKLDIEKYRKEMEGYLAEYEAHKKETERRHTQEEMLLFRNARLQCGQAVNQEESAEIQNPAENTNVYTGIDYFDFENHFRGSRKEIKEAESIYLPYFKDKKFVLDLGCGRGEFLELLQENEIPYLGVDQYEEFVAFCQAKNLNAICQDAIKCLGTQKTDSVGGIFGGQLIEHLKTEQLLGLCRLAYEKLEDGGCLILETPNPMCLSVYRNAFYIDPSHQKPVHPKMMEYILKREGFRKVEIIFPDNSKCGYRLPLLNMDTAADLSEFNDGINLLSDILFGSEDYAVIAVK